MFFVRSLKILQLLFLKLISIETIDCFTNSNAENVKKTVWKVKKCFVRCVCVVCVSHLTHHYIKAEWKMKQRHLKALNIHYSSRVRSRLNVFLMIDWFGFHLFVICVCVFVCTFDVYVGPRVFALFYVILLLWLELNLKKQKTTATKQQEIDARLLHVVTTISRSLWV